MNADGHDETCIAQQRILQLAQADELLFACIFRHNLAIAFVQHHLLAVVRPAFNVGVRADQLADVRWELVLPEELHIVARVGLMHACRNDGAGVERGHVLVGLRRIPLRVRQRDVEVGLGGVRLKRARRIHGSLRRRPFKRRRLFEGRLHIARDSDDVMRTNKANLRIEPVMERLQQLVRRGMHRRQLS